MIIAGGELASLPAREQSVSMDGDPLESPLILYDT
jgi:hypothetical protein